MRFLSSAGAHRAYRLRPFFTHTPGPKDKCTRAFRDGTLRKPIMNTESKKVLLIEDDASITLVIKNRLEKSGFVVLTAVDGKSGLTMALSEKPDLIILDMLLPFMNGTELLTELRRDDWGKDAVVVALTNDSSEESLSATRALGIKEYIVKSNWSVEEALNRALVFIDEKVA
jgi:DNA-binding response OmpR family regulator